MQLAPIYKNKKVLVTGHTGFKGSWLCEWLLDLGAQVCGYSIDIPTKPSHFEILGLEKRIMHHQGDVRDLKKLSGIFSEFKPDFVFHLAAQPLVRVSYDHPVETFETNVVGTVNVLECIRKTDSVKVAVLVATDKCYENKEWEFGYRETDRLGGADPYSASKACAEIVFHSYRKSFFEKQPEKKIASARAGNVIGGGDWAVDRIVPDCVRAWENKKNPNIRNPKSTRPWQHVLEPLGGYLVLGACLFQGQKDVIGQSFNFGPGQDAVQTVDVLLRKMTAEWGNDVSWIVATPLDSHKKESNLLQLNCDRAWNRLGWKSKLSFDEAVQMTTLWYQSHLKEPKSLVDLTKKQIASYQIKLEANV